MTISDMAARLSDMYGGDSVASEWDSAHGRPTEMPASGDPMARFIVLVLKSMWDDKATEAKNKENLADAFDMGDAALREIVEELTK